jgi:HK97 family phage major capsid protein
MAITAPTKLSDLSGFIDPVTSDYIFERAARSSVVQQLVRRVPLGPAGTRIPVVTGRPVAGWVGEGEKKPATQGSITPKTIEPKKLAAIMVDSMEVVRLNPAQFVDRMRNSFAEAFAIAFDRAALHDEGPSGSAGGGPFSTYVAQTTKVQELGGTSQANGGIFVDLNEAMKDVVTDVDATGRRFQLTGWALDPVVEPLLWGSVDTTGRPIWTDLPTDDNAPAISAAGRLLGRRSFMGEGVASANLTDVVGFGGDWSQAAWGAVGGISYRISTEASVTIDGAAVSLFEHNLVAILAEAEYGFLLNDADAFVELTNTNNTPVTSS